MTNLEVYRLSLYLDFDADPQSLSRCNDNISLLLIMAGSATLI